MRNESALDIIIEETAGIARTHEPITQGIPFPKSSVSSETSFQILDEEGYALPIETTPLARWNDGSIKWLLLDSQVSLTAKTRKTLKLFWGSEKKAPGKQDFVPLKFRQERECIFIHTDITEFTLHPKILSLFNQITIDDHPLLRKNASRIVLLDEHGQEWEPHIDKWAIETQNPLRMILSFEGPFKSGNHSHTLQYICYVTFFAGKSIVRIDFTLWNPRAAHHPGGVWDLGDKGSVFFRALNLELETQPSEQAPVSYYALDTGESMNRIDGNLKVYQDSSGGEHWRSRNHMNRDKEIPLTFQGFEVINEQRVISRGLRATPCVASSNKNGAIVAGLKHFWQNFPKALEVDDGHIKIDLFPECPHALFELQGGEQKTHTFYVNSTIDPVPCGVLDWIHAPLSPQISPEWYHRSGACPSSKNVTVDASSATYQNIVNRAVYGENSFFARREIIDEYGWRNFGDLYADHEAVFHKGEHEFISHYNNQFDIIKGALLHFMKTGESMWFQLADELARHVSDIDIYHTDEDRYEFNNGLFWHTDHHLEAATCTHRCSSREHRNFKAPHLVGGGPSPSHNYATGFLYHYWLTGDPWSKKSVLALADSIVKNVEGSDILLERCISMGKKFVKRLIKTCKSSLEEHEIVYELDGPGRASGNALSTLLDAYLLTSEPYYMTCAERLITHCVSPDDNIDARNLLHVEFRWMYTVFLQSLGKYLDIKCEKEQQDDFFGYSREVLLKYAKWMFEHEYPYLEKPEILEFPNESWSAQEIRKSDVLAYAAKYAPEPFRQRFQEKARFFFETSIKQLQNDFTDTKDLTRVIAVLMSNGMTYMDSIANDISPHDTILQDINVSGNIKERHHKRIDMLRRSMKILQHVSFKREVLWLKRQLRRR